MAKKDILKAILMTAANVAASSVPGGTAVQGGIEAIVETLRDGDPSDNVNDMADAFAEIAVGSVAVAENVKAKDLLNDPIFAQMVDNLRGQVKLMAQLAPRLKPIPPQPAL